MKHTGAESQKTVILPTFEQVEEERRRIRHRQRYQRTLVSTVSVLIVVAAIAVLISTLFLPVIQVVGNSMEPTLSSGDILVLVNSGSYKRGEICCISWQNKKLLKRIVGLPGDTVSMDAEGNVYVNKELLQEPYISEKHLGECDIDFPCIVPEGRLFVLGDQRESSVDSRSSAIGCVDEDQVVGHVWFRLWPLWD